MKIQDGFQNDNKNIQIIIPPVSNFQVFDIYWYCFFHQRKWHTLRTRMKKVSFEIWIWVCPGTDWWFLLQRTCTCFSVCLKSASTESSIFKRLILEGRRSVAARNTLVQIAFCNFKKIRCCLVIMVLRMAGVSRYLVYLFT